MSGVSFPFNRFSEISKIVSENAKRAEQDAGQVALQYAQDNVQVLTGVTKESLHLENDRDSVVLVAGGASLFLEFGTVNMRAFPFLRPAMDQAVSEISGDHLKTSFEDGLKS